MFKIRNKSLDPLFKKYKIKSLSELSDDQLMELCVSEKNLNTHPKYFMEKRTDDSFIRGDFDRFKTIDAIIAAHSYSEYMSNSYWEKRHREKVSARKAKRVTAFHKEGEETFKLFQNLQMGFFRLKPGDEIVLDITKRWIKEYLLGEREVRIQEEGVNKKAMVPSPYTDRLEVTDLEKDVEEVKEEATAGESERRKILGRLSYKELQSMASKKNFNPIGKSKAALVDLLSK